MTQQITICQLSKQHYQEIVAIANDLSEWFDDSGRANIAIDIRHQTGYVALDQHEVIGFVSLFVYEGALNIGWIGVKRAYHHQGIGRKLIEETIRHARKIGLDTIKVYTLGDSVDYAPYEATRKFYAGCGFRVFQRSQTDNPNCPEEMKLQYDISRITA